LVKPVVSSHEAFHDFPADALALVLGEDEQMRIVDYERTVRNRIS